MNTLSWVSPAQDAIENVSKEVKILEELLNLPKSPPTGPGSGSGPGTCSLPCASYSLPEPRSTLMSGAADQTLKISSSSDMALMATLKHKQIAGSMNSIASSLFQSTSAVLYTGHCVGGDSNNYSEFGANSLAALACSLNIPSVSSDGMGPNASTPRLFPNFTPTTSYQFVRQFDHVDSSAMAYMRMKKSAYEKENLYENYVMHGSHFLCDSIMNNNEIAHTEVPDLNDTLKMYDMESLEEIMDFLTPEIDIKVSDELVRFFPTSEEDEGVTSRGTGEKRLVVKLEKYYYCTKCKNNCYFTPDLVKHFKFCSKYISEETNYNTLKKIVKNRRIRPPTIKIIKPRVIDRQVFVINGVMIKCDKRLLVEDAKLREKPFVKLTKFYHCPNCDKNFVIGSKQLFFHLKRRTPCVPKPKRTKTLGRPKSLIKKIKKPTSYECEICALKFKKEELFTAHIESLHNGVIRYKCTFCSFVFADLKLKLEHIAFNHLAIVPCYARFRCRRSSCHRTFYSVSERERHEREHKDDDLLYKCVTCARPFRTLNAFKSHVKGHGTPFQIACTDCTEIFQKSGLYRIHLRAAHQKGISPLRFPQKTKRIESVGPKKIPRNNKNSNVEVLIDGIPELGETLCKNIGFQSEVEGEKPEVEVKDLPAEVTPTLQDSESEPEPDPGPEPEPEPDLPPTPLPIVLPPPPPPPPRRKSKPTKDENKVEVLVETIPQNFEFMDIGKVYSSVPRRNKRVRKAIEVIEID